MTTVNLAAYTSPTPHSGFPSYISVNQSEEGGCTITVRPDQQADGNPAYATTTIKLTPDDFDAFMDQLFKNYRP